jgi:hypothetical protein
MVRANGANTNTEIRALFSPHPPARRSRFNAPSPATGGGIGCRWRLGQRRARGRAGRARAALRASPGAHPYTAANPDRARAPPPARHRPASSRTTRKDFWCG